MRKFTSLLFVALLLVINTCLIAGEIQVPITTNTLIESPDSASGMKNFLVKFDIPDRVIGKNIDLASLFIPFDVSDVSRGEMKLPLHLDARPVSVSWSSGTASWSRIWHDSTGAFISNISYGGEVIEEPPLENTLFIDITRIVQRWADRAYPNHGLCLLPAKNISARLNSISIDEVGYYGVVKIFYSNKME